MNFFTGASSAVFLAICFASASTVEAAEEATSFGNPRGGGEGLLANDAALAAEPVASCSRFQKLRKGKSRTPLRTWRGLCVVSRRHSLLWLPIPKTGSSTARNWLVNTFCYNGAGALHQANLLNFTEHCDPDTLQTVDCRAALAEHHRNYTVYSIVRDPWRRALSQYYYGKACYREWLAKAPLLGFFPKRTSFPSFRAAMTKGRYEELDQGFRARIGNHLGSQSPFITSSDGQPAVDYLIRLEHLQDDFLCMFEAEGVAVPGQVPAVGQLRSTSKLQKEHGHDEAMLVVAHYNDDFVLLGSETLQIPGPCDGGASVDRQPLHRFLTHNSSQAKRGEIKFHATRVKKTVVEIGCRTILECGGDVRVQCLPAFCREVHHQRRSKTVHVESKAFCSQSPSVFAPDDL